VYLDGQQAVLYRSKMNPGLGRNFEALHPLEWLARMCSARSQCASDSTSPANLEPAEATKGEAPPIRGPLRFGGGRIGGRDHALSARFGPLDPRPLARCA